MEFLNDLRNGPGCNGLRCDGGNGQRRPFGRQLVHPNRHFDKLDRVRLAHNLAQYDPEKNICRIVHDGPLAHGLPKRPPLIRYRIRDHS